MAKNVKNDHLNAITAEEALKLYCEKNNKGAGHADKIKKFLSVININISDLSISQLSNIDFNSLDCRAIAIQIIESNGGTVNG